jgi:hypothetical protein
MKLFILLSGILFISTSVFATGAQNLKKSTVAKRKAASDDDCTLNFDATSALIDKDSKQLRSYVGIAKDTKAKIQMESVILADGHFLTATTGGCAHIGQVFYYSELGIKSDEQAVDTMIKNLQATPTAEYGKGVKLLWLEGLKKWKAKPTKSENKIIDFSDGDNQLSVGYDVDGLLRIEYSFAL